MADVKPFETVPNPGVVPKDCECIYCNKALTPEDTKTSKMEAEHTHPMCAGCLARHIATPCSVCGSGSKDNNICFCVACSKPYCENCNGEGNDKCDNCDPETEE